MDLIGTTNSAIAIVTRLREISKNLEEAEFKNLLADLASELADLKLEAASYKEQIAALSEENALLKEIKPESDQKPTGTKWGCYVFDDDDGLYCTACWDSKRQKSRTTRATSNYRLCPVCRAPIGS